MDFTKICDNDFMAEYRRRFQLASGTFVNSSEEVVLHLGAYYGDRDREQFLAVYLNGRNEIICTEVLFAGSLTTAAVYPREVVKSALKNEAAALILSHNHPSGNLRPSQDDIRITKKLKEALATVDIQVHDHIIFTTSGYYSFGDKGLI